MAARLAFSGLYISYDEGKRSARTSLHDMTPEAYSALH